MALSNKKELVEFWHTSRTFCRQIDNYASLLGLDIKRVEDYKYASRFFTNMNAPQTDDAWDENLVRNQLENLHLQFAHLAQDCKNNKNYSLSIGIDLGIERRLMITSG